MYASCLLYNMCICRLHHYNSYTSRFVPKNEKWCHVSISRHEINDPWPSIYWKRSDSMLQFHLKDINEPILIYGKEEKKFNFERKVTMEKLFISYWVCIPLSFKFEHSVQPPRSSLNDGEPHCLPSMSLSLVEDWSGGGPDGRDLVSRFWMCRHGSLSFIHSYWLHFNRNIIFSFN